MTALLVLLASCSHGQAEEPAPGGGVVMTSFTGSLRDVQWKVDVVRRPGELCTQVEMNGKQQALQCPPAADDSIPLNFSVDGSSNTIEIVFGITAQSVARLDVSTKDGAMSNPALRSVGTQKFFAFAALPGTRIDLVARSFDGRKLASGRDKLSENG